MAYVPNPDDAAAPLNTEYASTAAAEFRALKGKLNQFFDQTNINVAQNAIYTAKGLALIVSGGANDLLYGILGNPSRTAGNGNTIGGYFSSGIADNITLAGGSFIYGLLVEAVTGSINSLCNTLYGVSVICEQRNDGGQSGSVIGANFKFADRTASLEGGSVVGGLGDNLYNHSAIAINIASQRRSTATETCGWATGIKFATYALDDDDVVTAATSHPVAIDFVGIATSDAAKQPVPFSFAAASSETVDSDDGGAQSFDPTKVAGFLRVLVDGDNTYGIPLVTLATI